MGSLNSSSGRLGPLQTPYDAVADDGGVVVATVVVVVVVAVVFGVRFEVEGKRCN